MLYTVTGFCSYSPLLKIYFLRLSHSDLKCVSNVLRFLLKGILMSKFAFGVHQKIIFKGDNIGNLLAFSYVLFLLLNINGVAFSL
jgi:hypothetical protein